MIFFVFVYVNVLSIYINKYICTNCHNPFKIGTTARCVKASQKNKGWFLKNL